MTAPIDRGAFWDLGAVGKVEEKTVFVSTDGETHETMDEACRYQDELDFRNWCNQVFVHCEWEGLPAGTGIANAVLANFKVIPK